MRFVLAVELLRCLTLWPPNLSRPPPNSVICIALSICLVGFAQLPDMPLRVRVWGHFPTLPFLAVVGSRRPTQTAVSSVPWIVDAAVSSGWALLSGGARGVDGEVHRECLRRGGVTAVVLGSGLDRPYPPEHADLFRRVVAQGGCVLSEYEDDAPPRPWRFPQRNRLRHSGGGGPGG